MTKARDSIGKAFPRKPSKDQKLRERTRLIKETKEFTDQVNKDLKILAGINKRFKLPPGTKVAPGLAEPKGGPGFKGKPKRGIIGSGLPKKAKQRGVKRLPLGTKQVRPKKKINI